MNIVQPLDYYLLYMYNIKGETSASSVELVQNSINLMSPATLQHTLPITPDSFNQLILKFGFI